MNRYQKVYKLVEKTYLNSQEPFGLWMWKNHVPIVARWTKLLGKKYRASLDLVVAGALLHDFGDAFLHRHSKNHNEISIEKSNEILKQSGYSDNEIDEILQSIIAPHSCKNNFLPKTLEGKILATADALAHLTTDFYIQFAWMHLPENKNYKEFVKWVIEKLNRDFNSKIFFDEIKFKVKKRYQALITVFTKYDL